ncbi:MAG: thioredoxin [Chitinophagaceae bacterium]
MESFSQILNAEKPALVDFTAEWCGPCKMMAPELKKFASSHTDTVRVLKLDIDKNPAIAAQYQIQGVPTLILFKNGKILWRQSGAMSAADMARHVEPLVNQ